MRIQSHFYVYLLILVAGIAISATSSAQTNDDALNALPSALNTVGEEFSELTLEQALAHAYSAGFSVQAQQAVVAQGQALQREAQARWRPQVNVSARNTP
jgi:outer membrane protein TolC